MKYLKIFEKFIEFIENHNFDYSGRERQYYEINIPEFIKKFEDVFIIEYKNIENDSEYKSNFISFLKILGIGPNSIKYSFEPTNQARYIGIITNYIMDDKEIEFFDKANSNINYGRVKNIDVIKNTDPNRFDSNNFIIKINLYDEKYYLFADCSKPIKIYAKKTDLEEEIDFLSLTNKYNL